MKMKDYLDAINWSKEPLMDHDPDYDDPSVETDYSQFLINRWLSFHADCILYVNDLNQYPTLDKKMQFDYYRHAIRKKQRKSQQGSRYTPKKDKWYLELIQHYYNYNIRKAKEALTILTPDQLAYIEKILTEGTNWEEKETLPQLGQFPPRR